MFIEYYYDVYGFWLLLSCWQISFTLRKSPKPQQKERKPQKIKLKANSYYVFVYLFAFVFVFVFLFRFQFRFRFSFSYRFGLGQQLRPPVRVFECCVLAVSFMNAIRCASSHCHALWGVSEWQRPQQQQQRHLAVRPPIDADPLRSPPVPSRSDPIRSDPSKSLLALSAFIISSKFVFSRFMAMSSRCSPLPVNMFCPNWCTIHKNEIFVAFGIPYGIWKCRSGVV